MPVTARSTASRDGGRYPASLLQQMKEAHEWRIEARFRDRSRNAQPRFAVWSKQRRPQFTSELHGRRFGYFFRIGTRLPTAPSKIEPYTTARLCDRDGSLLAERGVRTPSKIRTPGVRPGGRGSRSGTSLFLRLPLSPFLHSSRKSARRHRGVAMSISATGSRLPGSGLRTAKRHYFGCAGRVASPVRQRIVSRSERNHHGGTRPSSSGTVGKHLVDWRAVAA